MKRFLLYLPVFFLIAWQASGATVPNQYIVQLSEEPAATHAVRMGHRARASDSEFGAHLATLRQHHLQMRRTLETKGAMVLGETAVASNLIFVQFPSQRASELASIPGVLRVYPVTLYAHTLDHALPLLKVPDAWNQVGGAGNAGAGIKVAVIDTGIDSNHPGFNDPSMTAPDGFPKTGKASDLAYTNGKIIVARSYAANAGSSTTSPAMDTAGHGTGVAMIVAGVAVNGPHGTISGIAPKAFLGNYKVFPDGANATAPDSGIMLAIDDAILDGMDILTLSLGQPLAPRPGDDPLVQTIEAATNAGKIVTISAGNSGSDPNTIGSPGTAPDAITVGSRPNDRMFAAAVQVPGIADIPAVPGTGPNSASPVSGPLADVSQLDVDGMACGTLPSGSLAGSVALILRGVCIFQDKINHAQQAGAIAVLVYNDAARSSLFGMDVGSAALPASSTDYADGSMLKMLIAGGPQTATLQFQTQPFPVSINQLTSFSSRGPNPDNAIKPDMLAIGENVYTADLTANSGFIVENGTSFSAPMVAGGAALLEAARPGLTFRQYRSLLVNTANPVALDSGTLLAPQQQGSGFLNVFAAINGTVTAEPSSLSFGIGSGTFDQTKTISITNVGTSSDTFSIAVQPLGGGPSPMPSANSVQIDPGQTQLITVEFTGAALDPGAYQGSLQIQGTQNQPIATVPYWYGVPSGIAAHQTVLYVPTTTGANARLTIYVRATDSAGLAVNTPPSVAVLAGGGRATTTQSVDGDYPGVFAISLRLGPASGANIFRVQTGDAFTDVTIQTP